VRYYAGKCGPDFACGSNNKLPCSWGAVKVMRAFSVLPAKQQTPAIKKAVERGIKFSSAWIPPQPGIRAGGRQTQPVLVQIRFPGVLHHGRAFKSWKS